MGMQNMKYTKSMKWLISIIQDPCTDTNVLLSYLSSSKGLGIHFLITLELRKKPIEELEKYLDILINLMFFQNIEFKTFKKIPTLESFTKNSVNPILFNF